MKIKSHVPKGNKTSSWSNAEADFDNGNDSLVIFGNPVMESWEKPYMKKLADTACLKGGKVLEVGFGLGIASSFIQQNAIKEHHIIEANQDVFKKLQEFSKQSKVKVFGYQGLWQEVITKFEENSFDGILYDTYPINEEELHIHQFNFIKTAYKLLKPNGVLTYCNFTSWGNLRKEYNDDYEMFEKTQSDKLTEIGFSKIKLHQVQVAPPESCNYYQFKTILAPEIIK